MANSLVIATDSRFIVTLANMARACADNVVAAVVGSADLAESVSVSGVDEVIHFDLPDDMPAEAMAQVLAEWTTVDAPAFIISNDAPAARTLLAASAGVVRASVLGGVVDAHREGDILVVHCEIAAGIALQEARVEGPLAAVYGGSDPAVDQHEPVRIVNANLQGFATSERVVERKLPATDAVDLSAASRIIGVGRGVKARGDLAVIEELASSLGAVMACTLPVSEDSHWYPAEQVLGSSHNSASPDLYIALGISGSPNHMSGVKDAGLVVAVNNDAKAEVFKRCDYGVVADLYDFVPALKGALGE